MSHFDEKIQNKVKFIIKEKLEKRERKIDREKNWVYLDYII